MNIRVQRERDRSSFRLRRSGFWKFGFTESCSSPSDMLGDEGGDFDLFTVGGIAELQANRNVLYRI